jgi:hypothetical protein
MDPGPGRIENELKGWIRICNKSFRIRQGSYQVPVLSYGFFDKITNIIFILSLMVCFELQAKYIAFLSSTRYSNPSGVEPQDHAQVLALTKVQGVGRSYVDCRRSISLSSLLPATPIRRVFSHRTMHKFSPSPRYKGARRS